MPITKAAVAAIAEKAGRFIDLSSERTFWIIRAWGEAPARERQV
jgi:hypothetical protein